MRPTSAGEEELQLQLALAMSKEEHDEELRRKKGDEAKLQMALDESRRQSAAAAAVAPVSPVHGAEVSYFTRDLYTVWARKIQYSLGCNFINFR